MSDFSNDLYAHVAALRRYAMALARNPHEADDLVQETLKRAIAYARRGGEIESLRAFLFTVLHNVWINDRKKNVNALKHLTLDDMAEQVEVPGNQHSHMELRELKGFLDELPDDQRQVVLLVGLEGFAYREVAEMLQVPIGTVMSRLSRARRALARKLDQSAPSSSRGAVCIGARAR